MPAQGSMLECGLAADGLAADKTERSAIGAAAVGVFVDELVGPVSVALVRAAAGPIRTVGRRAFAGVVDDRFVAV